MGPGSASQSWPCTPLARSSTLPGSPSTSSLTSLSLQDSSGCCWRQPGEATSALVPTAHPHCREREGQVRAPRTPPSSEGLPISPASLRCAPSHTDSCQNKCGLLVACGRSRAGLKSSIHMVKSDQMYLFLITSYTHAGRFGIQLL